MIDIGKKKVSIVVSNDVPKKNAIGVSTDDSEKIYIRKHTVEKILSKFGL